MPVAIAKMFGSKMMSSGGKPTSSTRILEARAQISVLRAHVVRLAGDAQRLLELAVQDHPREAFRAGDVGAFADVDEERVFADQHGLEARQAHRWNGGRGGGGVGRHLHLRSCRKRRTAA